MNDRIYTQKLTSWVIAWFANEFCSSVNVIEVQEGDEHCKANGVDKYINCSYCSNDEIYLGIYDDQELKLLSFFHELGHLKDTTDWDWELDTRKNAQYKIEQRAWEIGYEIALLNHIEFSDKAKQWALEQLETYFD